MKIKFNFLLLVVCCFTFSSCSWMEFFIVVNASSSAIVVNYQISDDSGFSIFESVPNGNKLDVSGEIVFNEPVTLIDLDTSKLAVSVKVLPKTTLTIGHLMNDRYKKYNQKFINGRVFNLQKIEIKTEQKSVTILKNQFDKFFKKSDGVISYKIK